MKHCIKCLEKQSYLYDPSHIATGAFLSRPRDIYDAMSYIVRFDAHVRQMVRCCYRHTGRPPRKELGE